MDGRHRASTVNGLPSEVGMRIRKKAGVALMQVFQGRNKDESDEEERRSRSNSSIVDYLKGKRPRNHSTKSQYERSNSSDLLTPPFTVNDTTTFKIPKAKRSYHTWSWRRSSPVPDSRSPGKSSPKCPKKVSNFGTLGRLRRRRRAELDESTFTPNKDVAAWNGGTGAYEESSSIGLYPDQGDNSEFIEIQCGDRSSRRNSMASDYNDSTGDFDGLSSESSDGRSRVLSRNSSGASRNSSSLPLSPTRLSRASRKDEDPQSILKSINGAISPRQQRRAQALIASRVTRVAYSASEEEDSVRCVDNVYDETKEEEDVFVTWDGRNAVTLPRPRKRGELTSFKTG